MFVLRGVYYKPKLGFSLNRGIKTPHLDTDEINQISPTSSEVKSSCDVNEYGVVLKINE